MNLSDLKTMCWDLEEDTCEIGDVFCLRIQHDRRETYIEESINRLHFPAENESLIIMRVWDLGLHFCHQVLTPTFKQSLRVCSEKCSQVYDLWVFRVNICCSSFGLVTVASRLLPHGLWMVIAPHVGNIHGGLGLANSKWLVSSRLIIQTVLMNRW